MDWASLDSLGCKAAGAVAAVAPRHFVERMVFSSILA
jgi:hypothetical protein